MNFNYIKDQFINKHKIIDNIDYLHKYINFLVNYNLEENCTEYCENHHILPRSLFPNFLKDKNNLIKLKYSDHKLVHLWLYKAINIRSYQMPLNYMMSQYKNKEELSIASKRSWINLKNNKEVYDKWCLDHSNYMKNLTSDEQRRRANTFWNNITDDEYIIFCNNIKKYWTSENKKNKSDKMIEFYLNPENKLKKSIEVQLRWDNISTEDKINFDNKMDIVNKDENKRKIAGEKIKELWNKPEFLNKMKNRKSNPGIGIKLINKDKTEIIYNTMTLFTKEYNFSAHFIRKYIKNKEKIKETHLNDNNLILKDCLIEKYKI